MIELSVKEYCQECPDFDAKVSVKYDEIHDDRRCKTTKTICTTVTCMHAKRCEGIKRYLERMEKDKADG